MDFINKVAIVTGSARGIGKALANILLKNGTKVCLMDIRDDLGNQTYEEFSKEFGNDRVIFVHCDVTNEVQFRGVFKTTMQKFGRLDIVINNAGMIHEREWSHVVDVNLKGVMQGTFLAMDHLRTDKGGHGGTIVNVGSGVSSFHAETQALIPSYCATKYGIIGFTRGWSQNRQAKNNGIRLVCLCPARVLTNITDVFDGMIEGDEQEYKDYVENYDPITTESVAEALLKLLKDGDNNGKYLNVYGKGTEVIMEYQ